MKDSGCFSGLCLFSLVEKIEDSGKEGLGGGRKETGGREKSDDRWIGGGRES